MTTLHEDLARAKAEGSPGIAAAVQAAIDRGEVDAKPEQPQAPEQPAADTEADEIDA